VIALLAMTTASMAIIQQETFVPFVAFFFFVIKLTGPRATAEVIRHGSSASWQRLIM
jgi:hypothetical protein